MFLTVILFIVRVPVLSEQISVELPKVSKLSNFFTKTFLSPNRVAIILSVLVTVAGNPYGTLATITIMNPSIKAKLNYLVTGIGLLAEDSEQLGADPHYVFTEILDYLLEQGLDLYSILDEEGMSVGGGGIAGVTDIYPSSGGDYGNTVVHRKNIVGKMLKRRRRR